MARVRRVIPAPPRPAPTIRSRGYDGDTAGLILTGWPTHVLTMRNAETDGRGWPRLHHLLTDATPPPHAMTLRFDDTSDPSDSRAPTDQHVSNIAEFAGAVGAGERLLILCTGGYGRSSAAAIISRALIGADATEAVQATFADRPRMTPNRLMIARADALLDMHGSLWSSYADWARRALGLHYAPPVPLRPGRRRRKGLRRREP